MPPANTFTQRTPAATARARNTLSSTVSRYSRLRLALLCLCISFVTHCLSPHSSLMRHFWLVLLIFWCLSGENAVEAGWFLNLEDIIDGLASCRLSRPLHQRTVFFRWESIRRFPGVSVQRVFIFNVRRPAPRGRGLGPQSRAHRLYFQGPVFLPSPDLRREGKRDVRFFFCGEIMTQRQEQQQQQQQCAEHATTNWLQRYNATAP